MLQRTSQLLLLALLIVMTTSTSAKIIHRRTLSSLKSPTDGTAGGRGRHNATAGGGRIAYGSWARAGMFPWAARLFYGDSGQCGGSLIYPRVILTAAHCFFDKGKYISLRDVTVQVGIVDVSVETNKVYKVSRLFIPSSYKPSDDRQFADIALLQLSTRATAPARPIALPSSTTAIRPGFKLTVMGWGETEDYDYAYDLSYVTQTVGTKTTCAKLHQSPLASDHFCVVPDPNGKVSCPGDSGGPYVYKPTAASRPVVLGVVSYGPDTACGDLGNHDFPTSVPFWRKWISSVIVKYKLQN